MVGGTYVFGDSPLHRTRPLVKIASLAVFCTGLFVVEGWGTVIAGGTLVGAGFVVAGLHLRHAAHALRPVFWILAAIFAVQIWLAGPLVAGFVVARFAVLILAAALVTLTTTTGEFVAGIEAALKHAPRWVPKERIALAISLALRFIPLVGSILDEVRQAQRARGHERNLTALLVPLVVRTLKTADDMARAIQSRSFD